MKSNNNLIISDENGQLDLNEIKLRMPSGTLHKRGQSKAQQPIEDQKNEYSMEEIVE